MTYLDDLDELRKKMDEVTGLNPILLGRVRNPLDPDSMAILSGYAMNSLYQSALAKMNKQRSDFVTWRVTEGIGVDVRQPRWMPTFLWKWMWRQVTITSTEPKCERVDD